MGDFKTTDLRKSYSELLHNSAIKWGLKEIPGRPLIGLPPAERSEKVDGIIGNPYQPDGLLPISETFECDVVRFTSIELFEFNGRWGYCLDLSLANGTHTYGAFLKFCDPYPTRQAALEAAVADIHRRADRERDKKIIGWATSLLAPKQMSLF